MNAPTVSHRPRAWLLLPLALAAALAWSPALAQDGTNDATGAAPTAAATPAAHHLRGRAFAHRLPGGMHERLAERFGGRAGADRSGPLGGRRALERRGEPGAAFARWLDADAPLGPVVPGLVGAVPEGTTVRLTFYIGAPDADGRELATATYVAGTTDVAAFRAEVRAAAAGADHVVVDVLGRVVPLPSDAADAAEDAAE